MRRYTTIHLVRDNLSRYIYIYVSGIYYWLINWYDCHLNVDIFNNCFGSVLIAYFPFTLRIRDVSTPTKLFSYCSLVCFVYICNIYTMCVLVCVCGMQILDIQFLYCNNFSTFWFGRERESCRWTVVCCIYMFVCVSVKCVWDYCVCAIYIYHIQVQCIAYICM